MRRAVRLLSTIALGTILALPASVLLAGGREEGRCLRLCLAARLSCWNACRPTCVALFPNHYENQNNCTKLCQNQCLAEERECEFRCTGTQPPVTGEEP